MKTSEKFRLILISLLVNGLLDIVVWGICSLMSFRNPDSYTRELSVLMLAGTIVIFASAPYFIYVLFLLFRPAQIPFSWKRSTISLLKVYTGCLCVSAAFFVWATASVR